MIPNVRASLASDSVIYSSTVHLVWYDALSAALPTTRDHKKQSNGTTDKQLSAVRVLIHEGSLKEKQ